MSCFSIFSIYHRYNNHIWSRFTTNPVQVIVRWANNPSGTSNRRRCGICVADPVSGVDFGVLNRSLWEKINTKTWTIPGSQEWWFKAGQKSKRLISRYISIETQHLITTPLELLLTEFSWLFKLCQWKSTKHTNGFNGCFWICLMFVGFLMIFVHYLSSRFKRWETQQQHARTWIWTSWNWVVKWPGEQKEAAVGSRTDRLQRWKMGEADKTYQTTCWVYHGISVYRSVSWICLRWHLITFFIVDQALFRDAFFSLFVAVVLVMDCDGNIILVELMLWSFRKVWKHSPQPFIFRCMSGMSHFWDGEQIRCTCSDHNDI